MRTATTIKHNESEKNSSISIRWVKTVFITFIAHLKHGQIVVKDGDQVSTFGDDESLSTKITVLDQRFYGKVVFGGSVGAGEAYIDDYWKVDDLTKLVRIIARNTAFLDRFEKKFKWLFQPYRLLKHIMNRNNKRGSKRNILSHYDLGNEMYSSFLDSSMMYSSAMYPSDASELEEAARHKLEVICRKLDLKPSDRVIEIGSGWCGFAIYAAKTYGCHITTTTLSDAQFEEGKRRIEKEGLSEQITLIQKDYRDLSGNYDKLVSIEMIEAVGHRYHPHFFEKCGELLHRGGKMLIQAITIRDQKYRQYRGDVDFIQRHIFPGGCLVSNTRMFDLISDKTDMVVSHLEDFGLHYARTIQDWRVKFNLSFADLKKRGYDERFRRLWNFYLSYCEGAFLERSISVVHLLADRPEYQED
jgi:cyclopropane-fatty-acyl-phospholipid synthase